MSTPAKTSWQAHRNTNSAARTVDEIEPFAIAFNTIKALLTDEEELRNREAILTLAEQSAGIGVWDIDLTAGTARGTAQFFRIMGLPPSSEPVPLERIRSLRHPDDREAVVRGFREALANGTDAYEMEYRIVRPDGQLRWIFGRGRVVRNRHGKPVRYSGVDIDITERKTTEAELAAAKQALERLNRELEARVRLRTAELESEAKRRTDAEARLHQAQKMEAVGQLTGGVAHDFNNILQVIMGHLEVLKRTLTHHEIKEEAWRTHVETGLRAARNAAQLTHQLLAFSRLQPLAPGMLEVNALIEEMSGMIRHTLGEMVEVRTELYPALWATFADRNQLQSALLNLFVNARDAMPQGGGLTIRTENVAVAPAEPGAEEIAPGDYVLVSVGDTGCGIAPQVIGKVFEPFFTTKDTGKGSGLGLSMVYGFVKQSGGHVRLHSELGRGTEVRMYLPRSTAAPSASAPVKISDALMRARAGETVLLVEDDDDVRRYVRSALEGLGYRVLQAGDGPSALRILEEQSAQRVDLLFTDVILPGGMSGRALADAAIAGRGQLSVLFTSGYTRDVIVHNGRLDDDVHLLSKPYDLETLARRVRQAIDRA